MIKEFKDSMKVEFEMSDMGLLHYFLGIEVKQEKHKITISQKQYAKGLIAKFNMHNASTSLTPMEFGLKLSRDSQGKMVDA